MPSPQEILDTATAMANGWRLLAIGWHVYLVALVTAVLFEPGLPRRVVAALLVTPVVSVGALAWTTGNWFNGWVFAILAVLLGAASTRMSDEPARPASRRAVIAGALLLVFGLAYPHFLNANSWVEYAYASPLGLLPCPTLTALIGITLLFGLFRERLWTATVAVAGLAYGAIGVFRLQVAIDFVLLGGAALLAIALAVQRMTWRSVRADAAEQTRRLPGDELIPDAIASLTHAITINRPRHEVWPWLAQMGAGRRAGWYSYDFLDNGRKPSASRIVPELQQLEPGMIFPALPKITDGFRLLKFEPRRFLVLGWGSPGERPTVTWTFSLEDAESGSTRLVVRASGGQNYRFQGLPVSVSKPLIRFVHFVMERKQLLGIAHRVERTAAA